MCAENVLDVVEKPPHEVQFRQRSGMFDMLQGKWIVADGGSRGASTVLKYAVEVKVPTDRWQATLVEPILEQCAVEDIPRNLEAIKNHVEKLHLQNRVAELRKSGEDRKADALERDAAKPKMATLISDFSALAAELERCYGASFDGYLPTRADLRKDSRTDIEKAITAHGGPAAVAEKMGWQLKIKRRKPRGYWDDADNILQEIKDFIIENDLPPKVMPRKIDFAKAGRHDLRRAIERWGGIYDLAQDLGLEMPSQGLSRDSDADSKEDEIGGRAPEAAKPQAVLTRARVFNGKAVNGKAVSGRAGFVDSDGKPSGGVEVRRVKQGARELRGKMRINVKDVDLFDGWFS